MATVTQFWAPNQMFQAPGTVLWTWKLGDGNFYWGYAVRPFQANMKVEITSQFTTSNNNLEWFENFVVTVSGFDRDPQGGGLLQFTAIKVTQP